MKKAMITAVLALVAGAAIAQSTSGFPPNPSDPAAVPIVESLAALFGIGGAYALRLIRKKKNKG